MRPPSRCGGMAFELIFLPRPIILSNRLSVTFISKMTVAEQDIAFGPYRLTRLLGRGGMAEVWRGLVLDPQSGRSSAVAVKRILPHLCDELPVVEMFLSEARIAMRLVHANIVRTVNAGLIKGQPYIAMELVDGVDLGRLLRNAPALPIAFCLAVARELCDALAYLHAS